MVQPILNKRGVTLENIVPIVIAMFVAGIIIAVAIEVETEVKITADQWICLDGYQMNGTECCQGGYPFNGTVCANCTETLNGTLCGAGSNENGTVTEGSFGAFSSVNASVDNIISGQGELAGWMDILVLVLIATIILGMVFLFGRGRGI